MNRRPMTQKEELYYLLEQNPEGLTKKEIRRMMAIDNVGDCVLKLRRHLEDTNSSYCITTTKIDKRNRYGVKCKVGLYQLRNIKEVEREKKSK